MGKLTVKGAVRPNANLLAAIGKATAASPYDVEVFSGTRGNKDSQHGQGRAIDLVLIAPDGTRIPNLGSREAFDIYESFAKQVHAAAPDVPGLRWGGYFGPSKLNAGGFDLMHFDYGSGKGMSRGSWEGGLNATGRAALAQLGSGKIYSSAGRIAAPDGRTYANLWGRGAQIASDFPMPRLRPATTPAGVAAAQFPSGAQINQFAAVNPRPSPVPPSAPRVVSNEAAYAPADQRASFPTEAVFATRRPTYAIPKAGEGALGSSDVLRQALAADPVAFGKAVEAVIFNKYGNNNPDSVKAYFTSFAKEQPALAQQVAANIAGNPAFMESIPAMARGAVQGALTSSTNPTIPGNQVPVPALRPSSATPVRTASIEPVAPTRTSYTPYTAAPSQPPMRSLPNSAATMSIQPKPQSSGSTLGRIATAATSARDWLTDLIAPPAKAMPSPAYNGAAISQYRPMVQKPTASATPPTITQASFNDRFDAKPAVDYATGARAASELQGYVPPPKVPLNLPNSSATMGIQPRPQRSSGSGLGAIATGLVSAGDWLKSAFRGNGTSSTPANEPTRYTAGISEYRPMVVQPRPAVQSQPKPISQASFNDRFGPIDYATGARAAAGLQTYVPPAPPSVPLNLPNSSMAMGIQPKPTTVTQSVAQPPKLNPAYIEWQNVTNANPELRGGPGALKAPPQFLPQAPVVTQRVVQAPAITVTPQASPQGTRQSNQQQRQSSPYYSTATTQGGVTVGRDTSGRTSYVRGPSGSFRVNGDGTYTSTTTGRTFSL